MTGQPFRIAVLLFTVLLLQAVTALTAPPAVAKEPVYTGTFSSLAVRGYDAVAYFVEGRPVEGRKGFEFEWNGATWRFVDAKNLAAFAADPEKFAPQYGAEHLGPGYPGQHRQGRRELARGPGINPSLVDNGPPDRPRDRYGP